MPHPPRAGRDLLGRRLGRIVNAPRRRVSFCTTGLDPGGAERALVEIALRLHERFETEVISLQPLPTDDGVDLPGRLRAAGIAVHAANLRGWWSLPAAAAFLFRHWRRTRPDLVQTWQFHANVLGGFLARRAGVPHLLLGVRVADRARSSRAGWEGYVARGCDGCVCVSRRTADFYAQRAGFPFDKLHVLPNGVELPPLDVPTPLPAELADLPAGTRILLSLGRLAPQKGLDRFFPIAERLLESHRDLVWVVVGDGPQRAELEARAAVRKRIRFVGRQPCAGPWLAAADVVVLPSRYEGLPNVLAEACAAGKPVLATDIEGVDELFETPDAQVLSGFDPAAWETRLTEFLADPNLRRELGRDNRLRAERLGNWDRAAERYAELYTSILGKH